MKRSPIIFSLQGGCPPEQHQPCSEGNMPDRLLLVDQSFFFQLHLEYYFSYFLSYSEAAVLAFSVTPGYFNPPHFWIWTGDFTFTSTFSFANEILFSPLPLFSGDPLLGGTHVHFISFMSKFHLFVFRWQLTFSLWCLLASLLSPYGGPSR